MNRLQNILLVDDDFASNFLTRSVLEEMDAAENIYVTKNGEEALQFIKSHCLESKNNCPELILLDVNMPIMDGFEFLEQFQKIEEINLHDTTVIMLTSSGRQKDIEKAKQYNIHCYLEKPLTETNLKAILP